MEDEVVGATTSTTPGHTIIPDLELVRKLTVARVRRAVDKRVCAPVHGLLAAMFAWVAARLVEPLDLRGRQAQVAARVSQAVEDVTNILERKPLGRLGPRARHELRDRRRGLRRQGRAVALADRQCGLKGRAAVKRQLVRE